jgi:all-trans-8'-apo-beta-carotenal 15,15'-oxygenase
MLTRRDFLQITGGAAAFLALPGCAASPPLRKEAFPDFGDPARPYLGLSTSLREEHNYEARVEGKLPEDLAGTLYRIGPGLFDRDGWRKRSLLDGDGMVQAFRLHGAGAHYRNRFVRTAKFVAEETAGRFIYPSWSTLAPGGMLANFMGVSRFKSQAGVTVYLRNGRLYAFDESFLPYELDPVTLETVGESWLGLPETLSTYSAHSKMDHQSGEWLHFGIWYGPRPKLHITVFDKGGGLKMHRELPMPRNAYMHDWFVSERHLILLLHPARIAYLGVLLGQRSLADSLRWTPEEGNLIMVLEREGNGVPLFLEAPPCFMWHSFNAYEKGEEIIADFIGYDNPDHLIGLKPAAFAVMGTDKGNYHYPGKVRRYVIAPARRSVRLELPGGENCEWPRINELHRCHTYRFGYMVEARPGDFFWTLISRLDMENGRTERFDFGAGCYCSEPVFAPLSSLRDLPTNGDEPGWLLTEVYDSRNRKSFLAVLRADRISEGPVATVHLNHHVPFSYHGWWSAEGGT